MDYESLIDNKKNKPILQSDRIESIDIIRGLTILVMIFVNDISGVPGTPAWMKHMPTTSDGMTFVDLVFPAFLFIVGMSIPFSIGRRLEKETGTWQTWKHILTRVLGLLIIGFFMVNSNNISDHGIIDPHVWVVLMYLCVIVIWNKNTSANFLNKKSIRLAAVAGLFILAIIYKGENQDGFIQMRTYWWEILGLIGWAYLVASLVYIPLRKSPLALTGSMILLYCFYMASEAGMLSDFTRLNNFIRSSTVLGSHPAIVISGILLGNQLQQYLINPDKTNIIKWSFGFSIFLLLGGLLLHELNDIHIMFIISKNLGTVPWCLISSAITIWIWIVIYWLVDMNFIKSWAKIIKPAGANPLFAYILAPLFVELFVLLAGLFGGFNFYYWIGQSFFPGFIRALLLALSMTWLTGYLCIKGLQLKL